MLRRTHRLLAVVVLVVVMASSCRSDVDLTTANPPVDDDAVTSAPVPTIDPQPTSPPPPTATPAPPTSVPTAAATTAPLPTSLPDLPGEPWDFLVPVLGEVVAVVGVAYDDILEVHAAPGENTPLVGTLAPLADDVIATGEGRSLPQSIWWRVTQGDVDGWVGSRFMSRLGVTNDITSQVVESIGEIPAAETMLDLGMIVAETRASVDPPSRVVVSVAPTVGDLGEITIDVVGLGDDAVEGERLHIFGQPLESGEGFSLMAVEATAMCSRGVTADSLCL